jgi:uncharacterized protein YybS (DUF2232 family)
MLPSILLAAGLFLLLYLTGFFVFFTPLPIALCALRRGVSSAALSLSLGLLVLALLYYLPPRPLSLLPLAGLHPDWDLSLTVGFSLIYFFYYGWLGLTIAVLAKRQFSLEKGMALLLASSLLVPSLFLAAFAAGQGIDLAGEFRAVLNHLFDQMVKVQEKSGFSGDETLFLKEYAPAVVRRLIELAPALAINVTLALASLNITFLRRWRMEERPFPRWIDYPLWRLGEKWIWFPIGAGGLYFLNLYLLRSDPLRIVLLNLLLVLGAVYFFQGLAVVSFFFRKRFSPLLRLFGYLLILLFMQIVGVVIMVLGLFDFWFDFRKLKRLA